MRLWRIRITEECFIGHIANVLSYVYQKLHGLSKIDNIHAIDIVQSRPDISFSWHVSFLLLICFATSELFLGELETDKHGML